MLIYLYSLFHELIFIYHTLAGLLQEMDSVEMQFEKEPMEDMRHQTQLLEKPNAMEHHTKLSDTEKSLELVGRELAKEQNIKWREHWPFLDEFIDFGNAKGLQKLEQYLKKRDNKTGDMTHPSIINLCERVQASTPKVPIPVSLPNAETLSYRCAQKFWHVYAKRMKSFVVGSAVQNDTLIAELKQLQSLINSYKEDLRFRSIDFQTAHSRFAQLIVRYVYEERVYNISEVCIVCILFKLVFFSSLVSATGQKFEYKIKFLTDKSQYHSNRAVHPEAW